MTNEQIEKQQPCDYCQQDKLHAEGFENRFWDLAKEEK